MKSGSDWKWWVALALAMGAFTGGAEAQTVTRTITLQPGWNSVWLDVAPAERDPETVFAGIPIASVWTPQGRLSEVDFIQDPNEPVWNRDTWLVHVPRDRVESLNNNLFAIHGGRAYLIELEGAAPAQWTVSGTPVVRWDPWKPDAFSLRGFPVDGDDPPTFIEYFRASPAHYDAGAGSLEKMYRMQPSGQWQVVSPDDEMAPNEAYWVYCRGGSDYVAPLGLDIASRDGLEFGRSLAENTILLWNRGPGARMVTVADEAAGTSLLSWKTTDANENVLWEVLPEELDLVVTNVATRLTLAIRRREFTSPEYATILTIRDGEGTRFEIPVTAEAGSPQEGNPFAGLWVGYASIDQVSEVTSESAGDPTPTGSDFNLRLLIHVSTNGQARFLKDVIQMREGPTYTNDANGFLRVSSPGRIVLITDATRIRQFQGVGLRDGVPVGRRLSSAGFDFPSTPTNNFLELTGSFDFGGRLEGVIDLAPGAPTNPFRHKYHPDHDNLDPTFRVFTAEAYRVLREIALEFSPTNMTGIASADYGHDVITGTYEETVSGLHKHPIRARGVFRLERVDRTGVLNP